VTPDFRHRARFLQRGEQLPGSPAGTGSCRQSGVRAKTQGERAEAEPAVNRATSGRCAVPDARSGPSTPSAQQRQASGTRSVSCRAAGSAPCGCKDSARSGLGKAREPERACRALATSFSPSIFPARANFC